MNPIVRSILPFILVAAIPATAVAQSAPPPPDMAISASDRRVIERGEYSAIEIIGGGVAGTFFGLGIGHAVQGRYGEKGWIFTVGELGSVGVMIAGAATCLDPEDCNPGLAGGLVIGGALGLFAFRTWEIADVWAGPLSHNRRVKQARRRAGLAPYVKKTPDRGAVVGLSLTF